MKRYVFGLCVLCLMGQAFATHQMNDTKASGKASSVVPSVAQSDNENRPTMTLTSNNTQSSVSGVAHTTNINQKQQINHTNTTVTNAAKTNQNKQTDGSKNDKNAFAKHLPSTVSGWLVWGVMSLLFLVLILVSILLMMVMKSQARTRQKNQKNQQLASVSKQSSFQNNRKTQGRHQVSDEISVVSQLGDSNAVKENIKPTNSPINTSPPVIGDDLVKNMGAGSQTLPKPDIRSSVTPVNDHQQDVVAVKLPESNKKPVGELVAQSVSNEIFEGAWHVFGCSMQGNDHLKMNPIVPCQDNHYMLSIDEQWGIAVVCDGAGSHKYSHFGSKFVSQFVAEQVCKSIKETNFYQSHTLPSEEGWRNWCKALVWQTRQALGDYVEAQKKQMEDIDIGNVGCTLIFAVYSPYGILSAHIGDGRAGYRNAKSWQSMMVPFNGEYSNQTVFLNSDYIYQHQLENPKEPNKPYLETRVIAGKIGAFVLMSDGCENGLYYVDEYDAVNKTVKDINRPIDGFDGIIQMLKDEKKKGGEQARALFLKMVQQGNQPLMEEGDDKTLILGYLAD